MKTIILIVSTFCMLFWGQQQRITIYMVGDSTMADKKPEKFPETGWGTPFKQLFNASVVVDNRALNGRSTKSFMQENKWKPIVDTLQPGDYVFIQFGHNDEKADKPEIGTSIEAFKSNLNIYIKQTLAAKAFPILLTPINRWKYDSTGKFIDTHGAYPAAVRDVAAANKIPLIDMYTITKLEMEKIGPVAAHQWFNHLQPAQHPNYPNGIKDNTHFNSVGALHMAQLVVAEMKAINLDICKRLIINKP